MIDDWDFDEDAAEPAKTQVSRPLHTRDMQIYSKLCAGMTYAAVGEDYGVSRQRIKQIANKLARAGFVVSALAVRQEIKRTEQLNKQTKRYGANYHAIMTDVELRRYLGKRLTTKRNNALAKGIEFGLTISDLYPLPKTCPVLGIELSYTNNGPADTAMSIDRIDPTKGYIQGNILLISQRANRIKNDATPLELQKIADFYSQFGTTT